MTDEMKAVIEAARTVALLRRTHDYHCRMTDNKDRCICEFRLFAPLRAALKALDERSEVVEWRVGPFPGSEVANASVPTPTRWSIIANERDDGRFNWFAAPELLLPKQDSSATLDEAKAAALRAARGEP